MLKKLLAMTGAQRAQVVQSIDPALLNESWARKRVRKLQGKQGGFTLLELLVVVAIIAAIAGTATILLRDTDRQASAAAHVAMMDELMKGISTYQVLNNGLLPDNWDSLQVTAGAAATTGALTAVVNADLGGALANATLTSNAQGNGTLDLLNKFGITKVRVIDSTIDPNGAGTGDCSDANIKALINNKGSDVTASTVFRSQDANGCGIARTLAAADVVKVWNSATAGNYERVNADVTKAPTQTLVALGIGPNLDLFQVEKRGAMTTVPAYRHVAADEYNRFVALLNVDTAAEEVRLQAIIDGAGDTKDEELGEWDGTRSSI